MSTKTNRRRFLQQASLAGAGLALGAPAAFAREQHFIPATVPEGELRVGIIGVGLRGQGHLDLLLRRSDCIVTAICDIDDGMIARARDICLDKKKPIPAIIQNGDYGYRELLAREDVDAVLIATPWRWHTVMSVDAMRAGKYVGVEVSGAFSLDECWQMVNTHEATGTHLFFLENVCYRRDVMAILNMVRQGLFGELIHLECGYQHDLRGVKFNDGKTPYDSGVEFGEKGYSEARWRTEHSVHRNGDLYPTHGIGPVAQYININRGNRISHLTSMASKSRGLHEYIVNHPQGGPDHPNAAVEFKLGDKVTTMLQTVNGETIVIHHDTNLPRPYSLGFRVQGTKGLWMDVNKSLHIEGTSPAHRWEEAAVYLEQYDHPLWKRYANDAAGAGHGGMDWFLLNSFVENAKRNTAPPFDVYDAATWMAITPLSETSISMGGVPQMMPDFTRGRWMDRENTFALGDEY